VKQLRFNDSLGTFHVHKMMLKLGLLEKLLVLVNNMLPFRWLFRLIHRGMVRSEFVVKEGQKALVCSLAILGRDGQLTLQGGHCYASLQEWASGIRRKIILGVFKTVLGLVTILLLLFELVSLCRRRSTSSAQGKLMGLPSIRVANCLGCQATKATLFQKPCQHILFCPECFRPGLCYLCREQVEATEEIFLC
jgi:hypothetical protein